MSRKTLLASAAVLAVAFAAPALAQNEGFYVGGGVGASIAGDDNANTANTSTKLDYDWDWAGLGTVGYGFGSGFRIEAELSQRNSDVDSVAGAAGTGSMDATALMANLVYDIDTGLGLKPYLGFGAGAVRLDAGTTAIAGSTLDDRDTVFGAQGILGLGYAVTSQLDLFGQYNYLRTADADMRLANGNAVSVGYDSHALFVGLRYSFGAPPAPAPVAQVAQPAPAPQPAPPPPPADIVRTYIVFFDWNSDAILPAARDTITQAVENAKRGGVSRLVLTGHADRSGATDYNQRLSERRALNVQAEMQAQGLSNVGYTVEARGEADPLVPTDDGVREPQNRRVEIVLQ